MATETTTKYICDCCGKESETKDFNNGLECGSSRIVISGHRGAQMYDGAWGGGNHKYDREVCFECADKVIKALQSMKAI